MLELLLIALAVGPGDLARDTLIDVREGDVVVLHDFRGALVVESWDRRVMMLESEGEDGVAFHVRREGGRLILRVHDEKGRSRDQDLRIVVPPWMNLEVSGRAFEARIENVEGTVRVSNLRGDLVLGNLPGEVLASSVQGSIEAWGLSGSAHLSSGDDFVRIRDSTGSIEVETVDGDVRMEGMASRRLTVRSTDGDLDFSGRLLAGGDYGFYTHGGEIHLRLARPVNVNATVLAYDGEFQSDFRVRTRGFESGEGLAFTIGEGGARLVLEAFDGDIQLRQRAEGGGIQ